MLNVKNILLEILVFGAILSSILVITAKNPVVSVIFLISLVLNAALYLLVKGIYFMGISYILIYLGAIIVLFLFVIMMINVRLTDILEIGYQYTKNIPLAFTVTSLFVYFFFYLLPSYINNPLYNSEDFSIINIIKEVTLIVNSFFLYIFDSNNVLSISEVSNISLISSNNWPETVISYSNHINSVANSLYTYGAFWFLLTSMILLLAMVAPIYISKK
jgi:NADH-ubiquinone oxidoreductase chain 6